jgi:hypothetical protein
MGTPLLSICGRVLLHAGAFAPISSAKGGEKAVFALASLLHCTVVSNQLITYLNLLAKGMP